MQITNGGKICTKCGEWKLLSEYNKFQKAADGYFYSCRVCVNAHRAKYGNRYRFSNLEKVKAQHKLSNWNLKLETLKRYGGVCQCCGENKIEFLCIDHINGGGGKERRETGKSGGIGFYRVLKRRGFPDGYQVLCHNCNMSLGAYGYCPHDSVTFEIEKLKERLDQWA